MALLAAASLVLAACSVTRIESEPAGAVISFSEDGISNWRPWPPPGLAVPGGGSATTPVRTIGFFGNTYFVRAEMDGYRTPLPRLVEMHDFRREAIDFALEELEETRTARLRAEGYVLYEGEWVVPAEAGIQQYEGVWMPEEEALRLAREAQGLRLYGGEWLPADVAEAREREDRLAAGFVEYKGRWMTPGDAAEQRRIDETVSAIASRKTYADLTAPRFESPMFAAGTTRVELFNASEAPAEFLFSGGTTSLSVVVPPLASRGVLDGEELTFPPGRYEVAIRPLGEGPGDDGDAYEPVWGSWPLAPGTRISFTYRGGEELAPIPEPGA